MSIRFLSIVDSKNKIKFISFLSHPIKSRETRSEKWLPFILIDEGHLVSVVTERWRKLRRWYCLLFTNNYCWLKFAIQQPQPNRYFGISLENTLNAEKSPKNHRNIRSWKFEMLYFYTYISFYCKFYTMKNNITLTSTFNATLWPIKWKQQKINFIHLFKNGNYKVIRSAVPSSETIMNLQSNWVVSLLWSTWCAAIQQL